MKSLFPEVVQLLQDESIPIIRSCPVGEEPSIHEAPAYFSYWMNAKVRFRGEIARLSEVIKINGKTTLSNMPCFLISSEDQVSGGYSPALQRKQHRAFKDDRPDIYWRQ